MKICFSSVCTDDSYQFFVPLFVYTVKKAYPDAGVKVFIKGTMKPAVRDALKLIPQGGWEVKDGCFKSYHKKPYVTNCLRFLVNEKEYKGYDYVFIKDIDFLIFSHKRSHIDYFKSAMGKLPYFGARGPYRHPRRYNINRIGWKGDFTRIAGGSFVLKNPDWFNKTRDILKEYRAHIKDGTSDGFDSHAPASYREYDEVMLFRIVRKAGLPAPTRKNKNVYKKHSPKLYRDIHLGDFTKKKHNKKRLGKRVAVENLKLFMKLEKDPVWLKIRKTVSHGKIRENLRRVRKYAIWRLHLSSSSGEKTAKKQSKNA
ncbi:MAG: hypothetical protein ACWGNI_00310 [Desulfobacterales bacterium]